MRRTGSRYVKVVDFIFYNEKMIRQAIVEARNDIPQVGKNGSGVGDPTATQAIRNATPIRFVNINGTRVERPESWLKVIDSTRAWFAMDNEKRIVMHDMYENVNYKATCAVLSIAPTTLHRFRQEIRMHASLCAANLNLIKFV